MVFHFFDPFKCLRKLFAFFLIHVHFFERSCVFIFSIHSHFLREAVCSFCRSIFIFQRSDSLFLDWSGTAASGGNCHQSGAPHRTEAQELCHGFVLAVSGVVVKKRSKHCAQMDILNLNGRSSHERSRQHLATIISRPGVSNAADISLQEETFPKEVHLFSDAQKNT